MTLWTKDDVPPAHRIDVGVQPPPAWQGVMWGTLPIGAGIFALLAVVAIPDRKRFAETVEFPAPAAEPVVLQEAK